VQVGLADPDMLGRPSVLSVNSSLAVAAVLSLSEGTAAAVLASVSGVAVGQPEVLDCP